MQVANLKSKNITILKNELRKGSSTDLERLAADFIEAATGLTVRLASSGTQFGADVGMLTATRTIRVEAKRYGETSSLSRHELLGKVAEAFQSDPLLEAWILVATKEVKEQPTSALREYSENHGIPVIILDWAGTVPMLTKLCAACPDLVRTRYGEQAAVAAETLASEIDVSSALDNLRKNFEEWSAGWAMTAKLCKNVVGETLRKRAESKALFRQDLAIKESDSGFVQRDALYSQLDDWKSTPDLNSPLLIIGEEGRGKSWVLSNWLYDQLGEDEVIVYCSSSEFPSLNEHTVDRVLSYALSKRTGMLGLNYWVKRLDHLKKAPAPNKPIIWLVIDGLNEASAVDWLGLFLDSQREIWQSRIRLIASCRTRDFVEKMQEGRCLSKRPTVVEVPPFTPEERDAALKLQGVDVCSLSESVLSLATTPRISRLVARISERLKGIEDITYERLLFEYGKRFDPDARLSLSDETWHAFLRELASAAQKDSTNAKQSQIREWIDIRDRETVEAALGDIVDGNLIQAGDPGIFEFDRGLVLFANGLALWKLIERSQIKEQSGLENLIARELEPLGGIDERPRIIWAVLAAALISKSMDVIRPAVAALLVEGITSQNLADDDEKSLLSYARSFPAGYLDALLALVRTSRRDEADVLTWAVQSVADGRHVQDAIIESASDWVRIVSLDIGNEEGKPEKERTRTKMFLRWFGEVPEVGNIEILGMPFVIVDGNNNSSNLSLYALRLIQSCPLSHATQFWRRFGIASVLDRSHLMTEYASWIVRLNRYDYIETCDFLIAEAEFLSSQLTCFNGDKNFPNRAAANLIWLIGDDLNDTRARYFVPEPDGWEWVKKDLQSPNTSMFQLHRCHVDAALEESEQHVSSLFGRAIKWWPDPELNISSNFITKAIDYAESFNFSEVNSGIGYTKEDHDIAQSYPALARCSPMMLSSVFHRQLGELSNRKGDKWAFLSYRLMDWWLIVNDRDSSKAKSELKRDDLGECDTGRKEMARFVLNMIAYRNSKPEEYLRSLITDGVESLTAEYISTFSAMPAEIANSLLSDISCLNDSKADWIYVNFLAHTATPVSDEVARYLISLTKSDLMGLRRIALYVLAIIKNGVISAEFSASGWTWRDVEDDAERFHGSRILIAADPPLPLADILNRITPCLLPALAYSRESLDEKIIIARTVTELLSKEGKPPRHPFDECFYIEPNTFQKAFSVIDLIEKGSEVIDTDFDTHYQRLEDARKVAFNLIEKERKRGLPFYGVWINDRHLEILLEAAPKELKYWLADIDSSGIELVDKIHVASGFYITLCKLLFSRGSEYAVNLWRKINKTANLTNYTRDNGLDEMLCIVFEAPETEEVRLLWSELWCITYANNNKSLFGIVLAAEVAGRGVWLNEVISKDSLSNKQWKLDRARFASAFRLKPVFNREDLNRNPGLVLHDDTIKETTVRIAARALWQKHWLNSYFTAVSSEDAMAAFILFLEVADSRWLLILKDIKNSGVSMSEDRCQYIRIRRKDIDKKIKKINDDLKNNFLGKKVRSELWPWCD